jgi:hemolysin III
MPDAAEITGKPLLRGWFHPAAGVASLVATIVLMVKTSDDIPRLVSLLVFGISMILLFTVSSVYHIGNWSPRVRPVLRAFDHSNIYVLIAGTYTPICVNILSGGMRIFVLTLIWCAAIAGISTSWISTRLPRWISTAIYIGMGWVVLIPLPTLFRRLPEGALIGLFLGGFSYTLGAVVYALKKPDPFPRVFGFHEIFHIFVVVGSVAFAAVIWIWVVPFPRI